MRSAINLVAELISRLTVPSSASQMKKFSVIKLVAEGLDLFGEPMVAYMNSESTSGGGR